MKHAELLKHIKENGITKVRLTHNFYDIPKGVALYFGIGCGNDAISTFDSYTNGLNHPIFNLGDSYEWDESWRTRYCGEFLIDEDIKINDKYELIINGNEITIIDSDEDAITLTKQDFKEIYKKIK